MNKDRLEDLLQECLSAYNAGLSPEECLSAFPRQRQELEPLLRQALSLRIAYATEPREEYRQQAREKLMFAAGSEVVQVLKSSLDEEWRQGARQRFIQSAGANAQEALRSVPPPRLPFWSNTRRRLLDVASTPKPQPRQAPVMALRAGLSAAVVALAIGVSGLAYVATQGRATPVSAQLQELDQQLQELEEQSAAGQSIPTEVLVELASKTYEISQKLDEQSGQAKKLDELIDRQKPLVTTAVSNETAPEPQLQQVQAQLIQAEVRITAARVETPVRIEAPVRIDTPVPAETPVPVETPVASATEPVIDPESTATSTPEPATATPTAAPTVSPTPPLALTGDQVRLTALTEDRTAGLSWFEVSTANMSFAVPADWDLIGTSLNADEILVTESRYLQFKIDELFLYANIQSGQISFVLNNKVTLLRDEGPNGAQIGLEELIKAAEDNTFVLWHILETVAFSDGAATATPDPTFTPAATP